MPKELNKNGKSDPTQHFDNFDAPGLADFDLHLGSILISDVEWSQGCFRGVT